MKRYAYSLPLAIVVLVVAVLISSPAAARGGPGEDRPDDSFAGRFVGSAPGIRVMAIPHQDESTFEFRYHSRLDDVVLETTVGPTSNRFRVTDGETTLEVETLWLREQSSMGRRLSSSEALIRVDFDGEVTQFFIGDQAGGPIYEQEGLKRVLGSLQKTSLGAYRLAAFQEAAAELIRRHPDAGWSTFLRDPLFVLGFPLADTGGVTRDTTCTWVPYNPQGCSVAEVCTSCGYGCAAGTVGCCLTSIIPCPSLRGGADGPDPPTWIFVGGADGPDPPS